MKYLDEYRRADAVRTLAHEISRTVTKPCVVMEVCGGQTHSIVRYGLDQILPASIELVHGPGCPVCVTPLEMIDRAHAIASRPEVIFCSFGDMLRVPGSHGDLLSLKSKGADVRIVYSPLDAVKLAAHHRDREVVFFAIGFETTAPANATAIAIAKRKALTNFSALVSHVLVPPSMTSILDSPGNRVRAFLGPGHVCAIMGTHEYEAIARRYGVPIAVTGFEPVDILAGLLAVVTQLEENRASVENAYARAAPREGNALARDAIDEVFEVVDRQWRGVGRIPKSGLKLRHEYRAFDAEHRFDVGGIEAIEPARCISGRILRGLARPCDCEAFGSACTPEHPLGATMVSSEGACAAYHAYRHLPIAPAMRGDA